MRMIKEKLNRESLMKFQRINEWQSKNLEFNKIISIKLSRNRS